MGGRGEISLSTEHGDLRPNDIAKLLRRLEVGQLRASLSLKVCGAPFRVKYHRMDCSARRALARLRRTNTITTIAKRVKIMAATMSPVEGPFFPLLKVVAALVVEVPEPDGLPEVSIPIPEAPNTEARSDPEPEEPFSTLTVPVLDLVPDPTKPPVEINPLAKGLAPGVPP